MAPQFLLPGTQRCCFDLGVFRARLFKYWLPVLVWMLVIFLGSSDALSSRHTSRWIGPFLRWLIPDISEAAVQRVQFVLRKSGHVAEYAILSALLWRALHYSRNSSEWAGREALAAFFLAAAYALSDEFHQSFVWTRLASAEDVLIDLLGAALGLAIWHWKIRLSPR